MKQETLDAFHEAVTMLSSASAELRERAYACRLLGLTQLGDDLGTIQCDVVAARDKVRVAYGEACYSATRAAEEATGNMIAAVLAVSTAKATTL